MRERERERERRRERGRERERELEKGYSNARTDSLCAMDQGGEGLTLYIV